MFLSRFRFCLVMLSSLPILAVACGPIGPIPPDTHQETPEPPILAASPRHADHGGPVASWSNPDVSTAAAPVLNVTAPIIHQPVATGPEPIAAAPVKPVEATELRVARLEAEVEALRRDMQLILPELRQLIAQKKTQVAAIKPAPVAPVAAPKAVVQRPVSHTAPRLSGIRSGEHTGKTRLVMDTGSKTPYRYDLDNAEKVLIIELPEAPSAGKPIAATLSKSPFVQSYALEAAEKGSRVIIQLKQPVKVVASEIGATKDVGNRVVFDLSAQ